MDGASVFVLLVLLAVAGCAGDAARPAVESEGVSGPAASAEATAPVPTAPAATDPEPAPAPEPAPTVVVVPPEPPILALSEDLRVRNESQLRASNSVIQLRYPVVQLEDEAARTDLDLRMRAIAMNATFGPLGSSRGRCQTTLATAELVSVVCEVSTRGNHEMPSQREAHAVTFRLGARGAQRVDPASAFVDGTQLKQAMCAKALGRAPDRDDSCIVVRVALGRDHLVGRWEPTGGRRGSIRSIRLPYAELAPLIRPDGILAFAAGDAPERPTPALVAAAPEPRTCSIYGEPAGPVSIGEAVLRSGVEHIYLMAIDAGEGLFQLSAPNVRDVRPEQIAALEGARGARADMPCGVQRAVLWRDVSTAAIDVHDAPGGERVGTLEPGTRIVAFDGVVEGRDSMTGRDPEGLWTYVVAPDAHGWAIVGTSVRLEP